MSTLEEVQRPMLRGVPVAWVPSSAGDYPDFAAWWQQAGRNNPRDAQGWSRISGPGVVRDRTELIPDAAWESLPASERALLEGWIQRLPLGVLYD